MRPLGSDRVWSYLICIIRTHSRWLSSSYVFPYCIPLETENQITESFLRTVLYHECIPLSHRNLNAPVCGADFHAKFGLAVSTQVRPRTKTAGVKWILEAEAERALWGRKRFPKNTWNITLSVAVLSIGHLTSRNLPLWEFWPTFGPPFPACFLSPKCLNLLHACVPQPILVCRSFHHPNVTSHLLIVTSIYFFWVTFSPLIKNMTLSQLP